MTIEVVERGEVDLDYPCFNDGRCAYCRELFEDWESVWTGLFGDYCSEECEELASRGIDWNKKSMFQQVNIDFITIPPI
jgi:hypothetical protein